MSDAAIRSIENRLVDEVSELAVRERRAAVVRERRDLLVAKLLHAGVSEHRVAQLCRISGPQLHRLRMQLEREGTLPQGVST